MHFTHVTQTQYTKTT